MMSMQDEDEVCGLDYVDFVNDEQKSTIERKLHDAFAGKYSAFEFSPQDSDLIFTSCFAKLLRPQLPEVSLVHFFYESSAHLWIPDGLDSWHGHAQVRKRLRFKVQGSLES